MTRHPQGRSGERGFALLFILLVAAGIAIALYAELPRVAFETQRNKEELLMQRGKEYQRAISLFYRKFNRLPAKLEDLEDTNNMRFLRRRYVDPMTGKNEWRLVHMVNGVLTDSLVKPMRQNDKDKQSSTGLTPASGMNVDPGLGGGAQQEQAEQQDVNVAVQRRASDRPLVGPMTNPAAPPDPNAPFAANQPPPAPGQPGAVPGQPGAVPGQPGALPGQPGVPGQPGAVPGQPGVPPGQPGQPQLAGAVGPDGQVAQSQPGQAGQPGQPGAAPVPAPGAQPQSPPLNPQQFPPAGSGGQQQAFNPSPVPGQPGAFQPQGGAQQQPGATNGGAASPSAFNNSGAQGIQNLAGGPRQMPGVAGVGASGIIGVATSYKGAAIKVYNEQKRYERWEFVWDPQKDPAILKNLPQIQQPTGLGTSSSSSSGPKK